MPASAPQPPFRRCSRDDAVPGAGDARLQSLLAQWTKQTLRTGEFALAPASADASFRRYFRVTPDAPWRGHADADRHGRAAAAGGLPSVRPRGRHCCAAPASTRRRCSRAIRTAGFLLLTDLGTRTYLAALDAASAPALYARRDRCAGPLAASHARRRRCRRYDEALLARELALFPDWYVGKASRRRAHAGAAADAGAGLPPDPRQQSRAAARVRPSRLSFAQSDGVRRPIPASSISRTR